MEGVRRQALAVSVACVVVAMIGAGCSATVSTAEPGASSAPSARSISPSGAIASLPAATAPASSPVAPSLAASPSPNGVPTGGSPSPISTGSPAPLAMPAADLTILSQSPVRLPDAHLVGPSPDGTRLAAISGDATQLCVYQLPSLEQVSCGALVAGGSSRPSHVDPLSVAWSPDSTRIVFTENLFMFLEESDIWTMDVASGGLVDLTDDGVSGSAIPVPANAQLDAAPAWMPDGGRIVFARTPASSHATEIDVIDATAGAQPALLARVSPDPETVYYGTRVSADGSKIAITLDPRQAQDPSGGIYLIGSDGLSSQHVLGPDPALKLPFLVGLDPGAALALVVYNQASTFANTAELSYLFDIADGSLDLARPAALREGSDLPVISAVLSPDGSKVAYSFRSGGSYKLAVRDVSGRPEHVLVERPADQVLGYGDRDIRLAWPTDTVLYAPTGPNTGLVFTLGVSTP